MKKIPKKIKSRIPELIALGLVIYYLIELNTGLNQTNFDLATPLIIAISGLAMAEGTRFVYIGFFGDEEFLGNLYKDRIYIGIGALAVVLIAAYQVIDLFQPVIG